MFFTCYTENQMKYSYSNYYKNPKQDNAMSKVADALFPEGKCEKAFESITQWPDYKQTDLISLDDFAKQMGVAKVFYKDESTRLNLGAFKALGGAYAVQHVIEAREAAGDDSPLTVCTATDGNHGRSVSWGAQQKNIPCHIFIHAGVSEGRAKILAANGATVHRVEGNYDDSIAECIKMAEANGWQIVSDTSWEGYTEIPTQIMAGYTVLAAEVIEQLDALKEKLTHIILPAGCGGMAGALVAYFWKHWREDLPEVIIMESYMSDCVLESMQRDEIFLVDIVDETLMAGLSCGEVSELAWPILRHGASHVLTVGDEGVKPMMRYLAKSEGERPNIVGGECSASGLITLKTMIDNPELAESANIDKNSVVLLLGTEGATDPDLYKEIVG
ncbi:MAG: diaminopropionate ammonia-lyase [Cocleimonas sp.]